MHRIRLLLNLLVGCSEPTDEVECGTAYGNQRVTCERRCAEAANVAFACPGVGSCVYQAEYEGELGCCGIEPFGDDLVYRWYACGSD